MAKGKAPRVARTQLNQSAAHEPEDEAVINTSIDDFNARIRLRE
jgi:hypothetical protein